MSQTHERVDLGSTPRTPRWVKLFGIIALVLILLAGIMLLSGGEHSPALHNPSADLTGAHVPPVEHGGQ